MGDEPPSPQMRNCNIIDAAEIDISSIFQLTNSVQPPQPPPPKCVVTFTVPLAPLLRDKFSPTPLYYRLIVK